MEGIAVSSYFDYFDVENNQMLKDCLNMGAIDFKEGNEKYFNECVWLIASTELLARQSALTEQFRGCSDQAQRMEIMQKLNIINKALREKKLEDFYVR